MTSNVGSSQIMQACINKTLSEYPSADALAEALRPVLYQTFKPAFLGRMKVVPYYAVGDDVLERIIRLKLDRVTARVGVNHRAALSHLVRLQALPLRHRAVTGHTRPPGRRLGAPGPERAEDRQRRIRRGYAGQGKLVA